MADGQRAGRKTKPPRSARLTIDFSGQRLLDRRSTQLRNEANGELGGLLQAGFRVVDAYFVTFKDLIDCRRERVHRACADLRFLKRAADVNLEEFVMVPWISSPTIGIFAQAAESVTNVILTSFVPKSRWPDPCIIMSLAAHLELLEGDPLPVDAVVRGRLVERLGDGQGEVGDLEQPEDQGQLEHFVAVDAHVTPAAAAFQIGVVFFQCEALADSRP